MEQLASYIVQWLSTYCREAQQHGFIVGISGGVDSALTSTLCAKTGLKTILLSMPIHQQPEQLLRARNHMDWLVEKYSNVETMELDLTMVFESLQNTLPENAASHELSMANTRSRLRMTTPYG